jgi:hypothetical protein
MRVMFELRFVTASSSRLLHWRVCVCVCVCLFFGLGVCECVCVCGGVQSRVRHTASGIQHTAYEHQA